MRRKDLSGAKMWIVACSLMAVEMDSRTAEVKISRDSRPVIRRVLLGGVGCERGGRLEKSSDMLGEWRLVVGGVGIMVVMVVVGVLVYYVVGWERGDRDGESGLDFGRRKRSVML
jgi:hypothetical protein